VLFLSSETETFYTSGRKEELDAWASEGGTNKSRNIQGPTQTALLKENRLASERHDNYQVP
jgi:hypothetical protein